MQPICVVIHKAWDTRQGVRAELGYKEKHVMSEAAGRGMCHGINQCRINLGFVGTKARDNWRAPDESNHVGTKAGVDWDKSKGTGAWDISVSF